MPTRRRLQRCGWALQCRTGSRNHLGRRLDDYLRAESAEQCQHSHSEEIVPRLDLHMPRNRQHSNRGEDLAKPRCAHKHTLPRFRCSGRADLGYTIDPHNPYRPAVHVSSSLQRCGCGCDELWLNSVRERSTRLNDSVHRSVRRFAVGDGLGDDLLPPAKDKTVKRRTDYSATLSQRGNRRCSSALARDGGCLAVWQFSYSVNARRTLSTHTGYFRPPARCGDSANARRCDRSHALT